MGGGIGMMCVSVALALCDGLNNINFTTTLLIQFFYFAN